MAPKAPTTTTQISKTELPKWVEQASESNYELAKDVAARPYEAYDGQRVAGLTGMEQAAGGTLNSGIGMTNTALGGALAAAGQAGTYRPQQVTAPGGVANVNAGGFLSRDIGAYMDPNLNNVVNTTLSGMDRGLAQQQQGVADQARGAGAWGSSRQGVQQAVLAAEGVNAKAATEAGLRSQAFNQASGLMQQDNASALQAALANQASGLQTQGMGLQAQTANQNAGLAGANLNLQGGALANAIGQTASDTAGKNSIIQSQLGATERGVNQAGLDANYSQWQEKRDYPQEQLNLQLAALGMSPYGKTSNTTTTQPSNSGSGLLTGLGAAASFLPFLFSDKKVKKNIKKLGKVPGTDLNEYEFEYKKGFAGGNGSKKQVGLMAQDVEKKVPSAVKNVKMGDGKTVKAVNYPLAILQGRKARSDKHKVRAPYRPRAA